MDETSSRKAAALAAARGLCRENGARLLYLTLFGSDLYGTATEKSDTDARGIFLPSLRSLVLDGGARSLRWSSGSQESRNSAGDIDVDLWSVDNWTRSLLPNGDTGALDLLFSVSNPDCVIFRDPMLDPVFGNPGKFLDLANNRAYARYSLSQAKKYGIKGSRLGAIRSVQKWIGENGAEGRLEEHIDAIVSSCGHESHCLATFIDGRKALVLCGKLHVGSIGMAEFEKRVERELGRYGQRAIDAERNQGIDFKALSHALRAADEMEELLLTGRIEFPLKSRERLMEVKAGKIPWATLEGEILGRLAEVDRLHGKLAGGFVFDREFADSFLLSCHGLGRGKSEAPAADPIRERLREIEKDNGVRILCAAESGSRAWGFPSADSDRDVRFVYVHDRGWYLDAAPEAKRDVIEESFDVDGIGILDMAGWELRKMLRLLSSGNPQVAEWLFSPIIYMEDPDFGAAMRSGLPSWLSGGGLWHHHMGLLKGAMKAIAKGDRSAKRLLYAARSILSLRWLESHGPLPPVEIAPMIAEIPDPAIRGAMRGLIERKANGLERDFPEGEAAIRVWAEGEAARLKDAPVPSYERERPPCDAIFRRFLPKRGECDDD